MVLVVSMIVSSCSLFGGADHKPKPATIHAVGKKVSTKVAPGHAFTIKLPGVATITGALGAVTAPGTITAQAAVGDDATTSGVEIAGKGVDVTFSGTQLLKPLQVTFQDVNLPSDATKMPGVLHRADDGTLNVLPADVLPNGDVRVSTKEFSINLPINIDLGKWLSDRFDSMVDFLGGRTDPDPCKNDAPSWAALTPAPSLVHQCLISNPDSNGVTRAEVQLKSNRRSPIFVQAPNGAAYVWADQFPLVRTALAKIAGEDRDTFVILPNGDKMTAGFYRPTQAQQLTFTVGVNGETKLLGLTTALLSALGLDYRSNLKAAVMVVGICGPRITGPINPDRVFDFLKCIAGEALGQLEDNDRAVLAALGLVGEQGFYNEGRDALMSVSTKLKILGKALAVLSIIGLARDTINNLVTEIVQMLAPEGSTAKLLLDPRRVAPAGGGNSGTGSGSGTGDVNPALSITGSCTSSAGTLHGNLTGFTPGGGVDYVAWYPNGQRYTNLRSHATADSTGAAPWSWPCNGDPAGTYSTEVVDDSTGASTGTVSFTIDRPAGSGGGNQGGNGGGNGGGGNGGNSEPVVSVYNQVTNGATQMREDSTPSYLSSATQTYCKRRGCMLAGTEMSTGHPLTVYCQTTGEQTTNGNNNDSTDANNPGRYTSTRYYGARWSDGRTGYISEVWINPSQRGGLGLPGC